VREAYPAAAQDRGPVRQGFAAVVLHPARGHVLLRAAETGVPCRITLALRCRSSVRRVGPILCREASGRDPEGILRP